MGLALTLLVLAAGDPGEWSSYGKPQKGSPAATEKAAPGGGVPKAAQARYQDAVAKLGARQYGPANDVLNALAAEHPRVPEIFASRCSAQLGLQHWAAALADCEYTLKLAELPTAVYGLAVAEDGLGKYDLAIAHYRQYAALPDATAQLRQQANERADLLLRRSGAAAPPPPPPPGKKAAAPVMAAAPAASSPSPARAPPAGAKGQFVPGIPDPNEGLLYVYRNVAAGVGTLATLYIDDARVGELWNDHYFEVRLTPGRRTLTVKAKAADGRAELSSSLSVEVGEGEVSYAKLDYAPQGGEPAFKVVQVGKEGRREIRSDCELVASKKL